MWSQRAGEDEIADALGEAAAAMLPFEKLLD
jgi:hypothetical protein